MSAAQLRQAHIAAAVIFLQTPLHLTVGIDFAEWTPSSSQNSNDSGLETQLQQEAGAKPLTGSSSSSVWVITGLDPGAHFAFWENPDKGLRSGQFLHVSAREVVVFRWDATAACFVRILDEEEVERFRIGHENLSLLTNAVVYPTSMLKDWAELSYCITRAGVMMLQGDDLTASRLCKPEYSLKSESTIEKFDEALDYSCSGCVDSPLKYTDTIKYGKIKAELGQRPTGNRLTSECIDRTNDLEDVLQRIRRRWREEILGEKEAVEGGDGSSLATQFHLQEIKALEERFSMTTEEILLLGELQVAYIGLHLKFDLISLDQWRNLLVLLANSESLVSSRRIGLGLEFIRTFYNQVNLCSDDILLSDITRSNFIVSSLISFVEICEESEGDGNNTPNPNRAKLCRRLKLLKDKVQQKFKMSITEMWLLQEDAPQIAETEEPIQSQ